MWRGLIGLALILASSSMCWAQTTTRASAAPAAVIILQGEVDNFNRNMLFRRVAEARAMGAGTVIFQINTWGGLVNAGLEISQFIKQQNDLHTIAFVDDKAISAGAMIAMACDEIVMEPGSTLGDSAPIAMDPAGGIQKLEGAERAKMESPILADFQDSATRNGHDPLLAEAMVAYGKTVHWIENQEGGRRFVDADEYAKLTADGSWKAVEGVKNPVDGPESLLTLVSTDAVKLGLATSEASSINTLAQDRGYTILATFQPSAGEKFIAFLDGGIVRFVLLIVFMQSLYAALHAPGHGFPEALAVSSLGVMIGIPLLTGYAQWWEVAAVLTGMMLLAVEIFVLPGFGISGIAGIVLMLGGLILTFAGNEPNIPGVLPSLGATWQAIQQGLIVVTGGLVCSILLWFWLNRYLPKLPYFNKLILATGGQTGTAIPPPEEALFPVRGMTGRAVTDLRPGGSAEFFDEAINDRRIVDVVSDSGFVRAGTNVVIREIEGSRIVVRTVT